MRHSRGLPRGLEQERLEREKELAVEKEKLEQERLEREKELAEERKRLEQERLEREKELASEREKLSEEQSLRDRELAEERERLEQEKGEISRERQEALELWMSARQFEDGKDKLTKEQKEILIDQEDEFGTKEEVMEDIIELAKLLEDKVFVFENTVISSKSDKIKMNFVLHLSDYPRTIRMRRALIDFLSE